MSRPTPLRFSHDPAHPHQLLDREWLLTNGTGSYSMGTALGAPTRRYHGLLIAATQPPVGRIVALNHIHEQLLLYKDNGDAQRPATQALETATLTFLGSEGERVYAPAGHRLLQQFERDLHATWTYQWGPVEVRRRLVLHWQEPAATVHYRIRGLDKAADRATLRLHPMLTLRDFHSLCHRAANPGLIAMPAGDTLTVHREHVAVTLQCAGGTFQTQEDWWYNVHYPLDAERGQGDREDYFVPGCFTVALNNEPTQELTLTVALGKKAVQPCTVTQARARHLKPIVEKMADLTATEEAGLDRLLAIAADDFVVQRQFGKQKLATILAGYPWFSDWGRDTFIALPGLLLCTGRHDQAKAVLQAFAEAIANGLVPNRFDDYDATAAHYNTVDASLWFIRAALQYRKATGDTQAWQDWLAKACVQIIEAYRKGTTPPEANDDKPLIYMDADGLIVAGHRNSQLTWMDAACGDVVFTPRPGKAVEINALWYHALRSLGEALPESFEKQAAEYLALSRQVHTSFNETFWREGLGYLIDHVWADEQGQVYEDRSVRPNQIFAAAMPNSPLATDRAEQVIAAVRRHLLTPVGLRTLPIDDPAYHGRYTGPQYQRDEAYHQGTIWPWLLGPYVEAVLRTGNFSKQACVTARELLTPLLDVLACKTPGLVGSIGQIHEIYEADADLHTGKHRPVGCMAQAWSISELIRCLDLLRQAQTAGA